jgi:hypothetical protein
MAKPFGRPTKYKPEYCDKLILYMAKGGVFEAFGATLDPLVSKVTLYDWCKAHPDFLNAKKIGTACSYNHYVNLGKEGLEGRIPGFNSTVWVFFMKNLFAWKDRVEFTEMDDIEDVEFIK